MTLSGFHLRARNLLFACLLGLAASASPAPAAAVSPPAPPTSSHRAPSHTAFAVPQTIAPLYAGLMDGVLGNRSRMIQLAFIGFAIGVAILMTATRKH